MRDSSRVKTRHEVCVRKIPATRKEQRNQQPELGGGKTKKDGGFGGSKPSSILQQNSALAATLCPDGKRNCRAGAKKRHRDTTKLITKSLECGLERSQYQSHRGPKQIRAARP
jgi:hypothetical protein